MPPLVSICIPTFSRAAQLGPTLARIASVIAGVRWQEKVEICISDNASADDAPAVIAAFQPDGIRVKKFRQIGQFGVGDNTQELK